MTRTIGLPSWAAEMLRAHKKRQIEERLAAGPAWQTSDLVFTTEIGTPLDMRRVNRRNFQRICKLGGIEGDIRPYDTRHTVASQMLDAGVSIEKVADVLGKSVRG